jgi:ribonucleoside-diphosphate reductase alpha chain
MDAFAHRIWAQKYRYADPNLGEEPDPGATWQRVATAVAAAEPGTTRDEARVRFLEELSTERFLPGGRIIAGAGTRLEVTLLNCFVAGLIDDNIEGIFRALEDAAMTMQRGGGIGLDFSTLRPRGSRSRRAGTGASGPVSFMEIFDASCRVLLSTGPRRGAMMATLRCDHPDVEEFIRAKQRIGLSCFNLSVQVTDDFMSAVDRGEEWPLVFPAAAIPDATGDVVRRAWPGHPEGVDCRVLRRVPAPALWRTLIECAEQSGEPGVLFVDRINRRNNLWYRENLTCTNPCGEVPLPPHGACDLGSINLVRFVSGPFTPHAQFDFTAFARTAAVAVRFLDDVLDVTPYPLEAQAVVSRGTRRLGLGVTGLADALILLGLRYDHAEGRDFAAKIFSQLRDAAYRASIALAQERGPFPFYEPELFTRGEYVRSLPGALQDGITEHGLRNAQLLAVAPTGSISLLAGNVSSGIEPLFALAWRRRLIERDGTLTEHPMTPYALRRWRVLKGTEAKLPQTFVDARAMPAAAQLEMLIALQPYVDGAISKTINLPAAEPLEPIFDRAWSAGLKGCTVFPPVGTLGAVLSR